MCQDGKGKKRKLHTRIRKKEVTEDSLKQEAGAAYLSRLGITWPFFSSVHARRGNALKLLMLTQFVERMPICSS